MKTEKDIRKALDELMALPPKERRENKAKIKALRVDLGAVISEGANPCNDCGNMPFGMRQPFAIKSRTYHMYEVGCLSCVNHRAQGMTREEAVENWNDCNFLPPKLQPEPKK